MKKVVVALGGNALVKEKQKATIASQFKNIQNALKFIPDLIKKNYSVVITFGNGFQVGNILIRVEEALGKAYSLPLELCVAESEGEIGYMIEQALQNILQKNKIRAAVVSILTQVLVDKKDPFFKHPTKPIGPFYKKSQIGKLKKKGFKVIEDSGRGYRRVVASPRPIKIIETDTIKKLVKNKTIVIAAGGGGIPVYKEKGKLKGIEAVIDKDLASQCLANSINANLFLNITGVDKVYLNFGKKNQKAIKKMNIKEAKLYLKQGQFAEGSMKPKIEAAIKFLNKGGKKVIITSPGKIMKSLKSMDGTVITK